MKLANLRRLALGLLLILLLPACNLPITPTPLPLPTAIPPVQTEPPAPAVIGAACVPGTWQINNLPEYLQLFLPQVVEGAAVTVEEISGNLTYTFRADGTSTGRADNFNIKAQVETNGLKLPGQILVAGTSNGSYQVDDTQGILTLNELNAGDLKVTASVAGMTVVRDMPVNNLMTIGGTGGTWVAYQCIGNTMQVTVEFPNTGERVVTLQRISN